MRLMSAVIALVLCGCAAGNPAATPTPPGPGTAAAPSSAITSPIAVPTAEPETRTRRPTDATGRVALAARVAPLTATWRPEGPVAIVEEHLLGGTLRIWAVPVAFGQNVIRGGGQNRRLVDVTAAASGGWAVRRDGSAFVFAVASYDGAGNEVRLALWDAATGATRWLTAADGDRTQEGTAAEWPVWSVDGSEVFFHRARYRQGAGTEDLGMWRIKPDGTGLALVMAPPANAPMGSVLHGVTPDGGGLLWGRVGMHVVNGQLDHMSTSVEILDLATGAQRSLGCCHAGIASWRATRPRALLIGDHAGLGQMILVLWDDSALSERTLLGPGWIGGADWDPQGERIVVASGNAMTKQPLSIIDRQRQDRDDVARHRRSGRAALGFHRDRLRPLGATSGRSECVRDPRDRPERGTARNAVRLGSLCPPCSDRAAVAATRARTTRPARHKVRFRGPGRAHGLGRTMVSALRNAD